MTTKQIAYKAMNIRGDGKYDCRGFIYEVGKTYIHDGALTLCESGFHCCPNAIDVYGYYSFGDNTEVMEVEIPRGAKIEKDGDKWCVSKIKILGPVEDKSFNIGKDNTAGYGNTGDRNTGDRNTGYGNTGDRNTGYRNTGYGNTGYRNTGDRNTGYRNTGDRNTGDRNTGNWNTASYQTGFFNTIEQPVTLFNGKATLSRQEFINHAGYSALLSVPLKLTKWTSNAELSDSEKTGEHTDGKQTAVGWVEAHKEWWANMSPTNKELVQTLPGFCPKVFKEITGITVRK